MVLSDSVSNAELRTNPLAKQHVLTIFLNII